MGTDTITALNPDQQNESASLQASVYCSHGVNIQLKSYTNCVTTVVYWYYSVSEANLKGGTIRGL